MEDVYDEAPDLPPPPRRIFCNRTLNLRRIEAVGFDMDYTLVHYDEVEWERHAYADLQTRLRTHGWPVDDLEFDPNLVALGLILDLRHGNIVKANRFGYVKSAAHGRRMLDFRECKSLYKRDPVDLKEARWVFLNTLFSLSEACMYAQMVDRLDEGRLDDVLGYEALYRTVRSNLDAAHLEGELKAAIMRDPTRFVVLDEQAPLALMDLKQAGKRLMLITNSEWPYTREMMSYAFDRYLPDGVSWRDLFELVIASARKPGFFEQRTPWFEIIDEQGRLLPVNRPESNKMYVGGNAAGVEEFLDVDGEQILYIGDHIFSDVRVSRSMLRWRTALVLRQLEDEVEALESFEAQQVDLSRMMAEKDAMEHRFSRLRLGAQRKRKGYGPQPTESVKSLERRMTALREQLVDLDAKIAPLAAAGSELRSERWGLLLRTGNDKSHLARQIERYADVYMSRVSNLLALTPFVYLRSPRTSLPHDDAGR